MQKFMCMTNGNGYEAIETADITKTLPITPAHTHTSIHISGKWLWEEDYQANYNGCENNFGGHIVVCNRFRNWMTFEWHM